MSRRLKPEMSNTGQQPRADGADGTMSVSQRSTAATKSIIKSMLDLMMSHKLLTRENHTPELDKAVKELVREIETVIRTNLLNFGNQVSAQTKAAAPASVARPKKEPGNRTKFLLRLMAGRFSHLFANKNGNSILPREVVMGFDNYLEKLLGEVLYEELNAEAGELLSLFDTDDDDLIWREIGNNDRHKRFAYNILIRILLKFEDFNWARKNFISILNNVTERKSGFLFEDQHFQLLFNALFSELFKVMWDDDEMVKLDFMFGGGTATKIDTIREEFKTYKEEWQKRQMEKAKK